MPFTLDSREVTIQSCFKHWLGTLPELAAELVEADSSLRIYPRQRTPGKDFPCVTYFTLAETGYDVLDRDASETLLTTIQIDIWARTERMARLLAWAIRGRPDEPRLHGFHGAMGDEDVGTIDVQCATVVDTRDLDEPPEGGGNEGIYRTSLDVSICWNEPRD